MVQEEEEELHENYATLEESPFFRDRSSSDSVAVMGNKSGKKQKEGRMQDDDANESGNKTITKRLSFQTPLKSPPAVAVQPKPDTDSSSTTEQNNVIEDSLHLQLQSHINKSVTSDTLYKDALEFTEVEDPSSYKEVAHHHTWTCDENLLLVASEGSDSINVPELPYEPESCSLNGIVLEELENVEPVPSHCEQESCETPQEPVDASLTSPKQEPTESEKSLEPAAVTVLESPSLFTGPKLLLTSKGLDYLNLEVSQFSFSYCSTAKQHILKIYDKNLVEGNKLVSY